MSGSTRQLPLEVKFQGMREENTSFKFSVRMSTPPTIGIQSLHNCIKQCNNLKLLPLYDFNSINVIQTKKYYDSNILNQAIVTYWWLNTIESSQYDEFCEEDFEEPKITDLMEFAGTKVGIKLLTTYLKIILNIISL